MKESQGSPFTQLFRIPLVLAAGLALTAIAGCGPDIDALCEEQESCRGGNEMDVEACIALYDAFAEHSSDTGCGDEFDEYYDCFIDSATCDTQSSGMPCANDDECHSSQICTSGECSSRDYGLTNPDDCEAERNAYNRCFDWD